jgi:hypothetical protein
VAAGQVGRVWRGRSRYCTAGLLLTPHCLWLLLLLWCCAALPLPPPRRGTAAGLICSYLSPHHIPMLSCSRSRSRCCGRPLACNWQRIY